MKELLDCALLGVCAGIRWNTVFAHGVCLALYKRGIQIEYFSYFYPTTNAVGTHLKHLNASYEH